MNCCGASGPKNFHHSRWFNNSLASGFVPVTCCVPYESVKDVDVDHTLSDLGLHRQRHSGPKVVGTSSSRDPVADGAADKQREKLNNHLTQCQIQALFLTDGEEDGEETTVRRLKTRVSKLMIMHVEVDNNLLCLRVTDFAIYGDQELYVFAA